MLRTLTFCTALLFLFSCKTQKVAVGGDKAVSAKIDSIMAKMTLDEKIGQMTLFTTDWESTGPTIREGYQDDIINGRCGSLFNSHTVAFTRQLQELAVKKSRLGIPLIFGYDVIHGYKTIFPMPLAESCSWDLEAIEHSASVAALEASAAGLHWTFAPMVDVSREPRWGRVMEGAGEDTYLGSLIARARVRGFQGDNFDHADKVMACIKHYAGYGAPLAGRDYNTVDMSERVLREVYLPPYKAGIDEGAMSIMTSFNEYDGIPATANKFLLQNVLRNEWGFKGFVVTDYTSINEMVNHGYARDETHAGELAVNAGVDMDLQGAVFSKYLKGSVEAKRVAEATIDASVRRILEAKFALGLFKDPYRFCNEAREKEIIFSPANHAAARDMARKSIVLLKNEKSVLPLSSKLNSIALIGPLAADNAQMLGAWSASGDGASCVSVKDALTDWAAKRHFKMKYAKGCEISGENKKDFTAAITAARNSDVAIVVVGESKEMSGEAASRADLNLPGVQEDLIRELIGTGTPVIVVLMSGRPLTIPYTADHATAVMEAWWLGTEAGNAVCDVLFGDYNPSGKLTMTFPRNLGQVPLFYSEKNTGRPFDASNKYTSKYLETPNTPQYPFGYGLSYTTFTYDSIQVSKTEFSMRDSLKISVKITNSGERAGEEIVQLYVRDLVGSVTRPMKELKGFQKIKLEKGESKMVNFSLVPHDLAFYTADMKFEAEPGVFWIMVGPDSERLQKKEVRLIK